MKKKVQGIIYKRPTLSTDIVSYAKHDSLLDGELGKAAKKSWKLKLPNKFGNLDQFTDENGKQQYKNNIVINHMTGEEISKIQCKNIGKIFDDLKEQGYRSPTTKELISIMNH